MKGTKTIIDSQQHKAKLISLCVFAVFFVVASIIFLVELSSFGNLITEYENHIHRESCYRHMGYSDLPIPYCRFSYFKTGEAYASQLFLETSVVNVLIILGIGVVVSVAVFLVLKYSDKIYKKINSSFIGGQKTKSSRNSVVIEKETNSIDDLIKLNELLDKGIITQAEFDTKKKQVLGI